MVRAMVKGELPSITTPYSNEIINADGSLLKNARADRQPINGLDSIAGDLDVVEMTIQTRLQEKKELDAKLAELEMLIRQARAEIRVEPVFKIVE